MLSAIKRSCPHVITVYGGVYPTYHAPEILTAEAAVDFIVRGEGDRNHPKEIHAVAVDPKTFDAYPGQYRFDVDDFVFTIYREGDHLRIQNGIDGPAYELVAISENEFTAREMAEIISFERDDQGRVTHLVSNLDEIAKKIK